MKINSIAYYNHELEWRFEPIYFSDFNLLVGVSGVGKTQIIESIINLSKIAIGDSFNGVQWDINFTCNNSEYQWSGEFETKKLDKIVKKLDKIVFIEDEQLKNEDFRINRESLYVNAQNIITRDEKEIIFNGIKLPKLSPFQSVIEILGEEEVIAPVKHSFNKVIYSDPSRMSSTPFGGFIFYMSHHINSLDKIKENDLPPQVKLALVYKYEHHVFQEIKNQFINIFDQVEDIKLEPDNDKTLPEILSKYPIIKIKEKGVDNWINQERISSGMLKTLMHIAELYLCAEGTVILIDEFENSLGINCIDVLSDLLFSNRDLQFIITSHHPYIINKIDMSHWKIVTRRGGVVSVKDAQDFNLGKSRHEAFMQLINLDAYREGIFVE